MINKKKYKVSFIVPVYNVENYISECLFSIFEINSFSYELIIVNDGSTDSSMDKIRDICQKRNNVLCIEQENKGLSAARNVGIIAAKGEYLFFVDSDDKISASNLQRIIKGIKGKEDIIIANFYTFNNNNIILNANRIPNGRIGTGCFFLQKYYLNDIYTVVWRSLYRKDFINKYSFRFMEGITYEDVEWSPRVLLQADYVVYYNTPIYYYRKREGSIVNSIFTHKKFDDIIKVCNSLIGYTSHFSKSQQKECSTIHDSIAYFLLLALANMRHDSPQSNIDNGINLFLVLQSKSAKYKLLKVIYSCYPPIFWYILYKKFGLK